MSEELRIKNRPKTLEEANAEIKRLQEELAIRMNNEVSREPIAIIGMGCRYPGGVRTPDEFWHLLSSGKDILRDIPTDRWDVEAHFDPEVTVPGKMYVRQGYYLDNIDQFDPQFLVCPLEKQKALIHSNVWLWRSVGRLLKMRALRPHP